MRSNEVTALPKTIKNCMQTNICTQGGDVSNQLLFINNSQ